MIKKILHVLLYCIAIIMVFGSVLSLFRNAEIRYIKMLDFPRIQFFITSIVCLVLVLMVFYKHWKWYGFLLIIGLISGIFINGYFLKNYTCLVPVEVPSVKEINSTSFQLSLLLSNVKMSNRKVAPLLAMVNNKNPDLFLAMEVDQWWDKELKLLEKQYPYSQETINDVAYGMVLYSKFPLEKVEVQYLNNKKVPSFKSTITLTNGKTISFYSIHPVPPTHFQDLPDNAGQQENALLKLGSEIKNRTFPTIVAGDVNDVVWSYVDELTGTKNILYDVRVGRGLYNSYNAENIFMRWPLDHVFVTKEFKLKKLERLPNIGSDHFPLYVELVL